MVVLLTSAESVDGRKDERIFRKQHEGNARLAFRYQYGRTPYRSEENYCNGDVDTTLLNT